MRVLITGCSSGIGRASAAELDRRGHEVIATARRVETLADVPAAQRLALDVTDPDAVESAVEAAGRIDALVNNAGFGVRGPVERVPLETIRDLFETNFFGAARLIQAVIPGMRERRGGVIVNLSSIAGRVSPPLSSFYAASKFAIEGLSEGMHIELGHFGIRTVMVQPGYIDTKFAGSSQSYGLDEAPYDELDRQYSGSDGVLIGGTRPGPELVGTAIADVIEGKETRLRVPVGVDAELVIGARDKQDDVEFEATMRKTLGLEW